MARQALSLCKTIYQSDLVIANDCGPSHIAQCLGTPFWASTKGR
ncbi:hypothetical protein DSL92_02490 [Billgrantia gudaonensis]|uniref:Glycosyltransferase family 9 protein n=1 Tax=Billgrantia gudaonensis TaxID=376427 RepID=A0A432JL03_9GAMM|nr:hypothetical protein DSL92_02490 [Halomonas gudaonensis]